MIARLAPRLSLLQLVFFRARAISLVNLVDLAASQFQQCYAPLGLCELFDVVWWNI